MTIDEQKFRERLAATRFLPDCWFTVNGQWRPYGEHYSSQQAAIDQSVGAALRLGYLTVH